MKPYAILLWAALVAGCGGSTEVEEASAEPETTGDERPAEREDDGVAISGLMGTIRQDQVENALDARRPRFMRCLSRRMGAVEYLSGDLRLSFRIHTDGTVAWVFPVRTTLGDREAEECALEVARSTRFPRPRGGEAEFTWGFGFEASEDMPPLLTWQAEALGSSEDAVREVARRCNARNRFDITAYIEPGGSVLAAGGAMPDADSAETLDCILEGIRGLTLPDPGSHPAKITFSVP